jgi:putative lipoprotein
MSWPAWGQADPWWGKDKARHFGASAALAMGGYAAAAPFTERPPLRLASGAALALSLGIAKELADRHTGGDPSLRDLTWDLAGTATGLCTAWLIDRWLFGGRGSGERPIARSKLPARPPPFEVISAAHVRK